MATTVAAPAPLEEDLEKIGGGHPSEAGGSTQPTAGTDLQAIFALLRPGQEYSPEQQALLAAQLRDMAARLNPGR